MAIILQDSFTNANGVNLISHVPQFGTWVYDRQHNNATVPTIVITSGGRVRSSANGSTNIGSVVSSAIAGSQAVSVEADLVKLSTAVSAAGLIICFNSTNYNHYLARLDTTTATATWQVHRWNANTATLLGSSTAGASNTPGTYRLKFSIDNAGNLLFQYSTDGGATYNTAVSVTDASFLPPGKVGIHLSAAGAVATDTTGYQFDNFVASDATVVPVATAYTLAASPSTINPSVSSATITVTSNGSLAAPVTVTLSDGDQGGSFSGPIVLPAGNNTRGTATYSNPTPKTVTITGTNNGGLSDTGTVSVIIANTVNLVPGDANYFVSPYNNLIVGRFARTNSPGFYLKVRFTGTRTVSIAVDVSSLVANNTALADYPTLRWTINNGAWQFLQLKNDSTSILLGTGLTATVTYELELYFWRVGNFNLDRWNTPINAIGFGAITLETGASFSAPALRPNRGLFFGDSITEGLTVLPAHSSTDHYVFHLGSALNSEYGSRGFGGQGWEFAGAGNVPKFSSSWNSLWNGQPLTFSPLPDFIVVMQGTNDGLNNVTDSVIQTSIQNWLALARNAVGVNCWIYIVIPFGGFKRAAITAAFNAYATSNTSDKRIKLIDLGTDGQKGVTAFSLGASNFSSDGIHPTQFNHARLAAMLAARTGLPSPIAPEPVSMSSVNFVRKRNR